MIDKPKCKVCVDNLPNQTLFNPSGSKGDWYCSNHLIQEFNRLSNKLKMTKITKVDDR